MSAEYLEAEKVYFKTQIRDLLHTFGKICSEKDFRKSFKSTYGYNINRDIDKFSAGSIHEFLRYQCQDLCEVIRNDGEMKIHKIDTSPPSSKGQKSKPKKNADIPKLNNPRTGIINESTFPRLNPQGFNKNKPKHNKPLTSLPQYSSKYSGTYRSADQLATFYADDEVDISNQRPSSVVNIAESLFGDKPATAPESPVKEIAFQEEIKKNAPNVMNPFDFPSLPGQSKAAQDDADKSSEEESEEEEVEPEDQTHFEQTCAAEQSFAVAVKTSQALESAKFLEGGILANFSNLIVVDPSFQLPSPKVHIFNERLVFQVHLTFISSPESFIFSYGEHSLRALMMQMKEVYSELMPGVLMVGAQNIQKGLIVAVNYQENWRRAKVMNIPDADQVELFLIDSGNRALVPRSTIRYLLKSFTCDPVKALRGSLVGVCPKYNEEKWTLQAQKSFIFAVEGKLLYAAFRTYRTDTEAFGIELFDEINSRVFNISELLIQRGLAAKAVIGETFPFAIPSSAQIN